ncbi:hypothetical protein [Snodgrassella alvi]|uniref:hypothetical protein n=1 Tax=Snodgrassella alvi TaxID=1196083 RepID=UPI0011872DF1|nr:hypothetical protein [Snodgrassella alvi]
MGEISKIQLLWISQRLNAIHEFKLWWIAPQLINQCQNSTVVISATVEDVRSLPNTKADNANLIN